MGDARRPQHAAGEAAPEPGLGEACRLWRQGDVFHGAVTFILDHEWSPLRVDSPAGAVVVSQSCDAAQPGRTRIQVAPVVHLEGADAKEAASGRRPRFVPVPRAGDGLFADLTGITTVAKTALVDCGLTRGVETDQEVREFAFSVARFFGRFAYPDAVAVCLRPLQDTIKKRAHKEASPMGRALCDVHAFRMFCETWAAPPFDLTLIVIMEPGVLPSDLDDTGQPPADLPRPGSDSSAALTTWYAEYLADVHDSGHRYWAWQYLITTWARQCEAAATEGGTGAVRSVTAELASTDDFPLSRYERTEALDLDYLSDSRKPIT